MGIRPLKNTVMFEFLDATHGHQGKFVPKVLPSGIVIAGTVSEQKKNKWGKVLAAGPDAGVVPGEYILIEALMWMEGTVVDGVKMWKTDDSKILAVTDDITQCQYQ